MSIQSSINSALSSIASAKFLKEVGGVAIQSIEEAEQRVKQHALAGQTLEDFLSAPVSATYSLEQSVAQMQPYRLSETGPRTSGTSMSAVPVTAQAASESADQSMQDAQFAKRRKAQMRTQAQEARILASTQPKEDK